MLPRLGPVASSLVERLCAGVACMPNFSQRLLDICVMITAHSPEVTCHAASVTLAVTLRKRGTLGHIHVHRIVLKLRQCRGSI